jgi:hypothetical protein
MFSRKSKSKQMTHDSKPPKEQKTLMASELPLPAWRSSRLAAYRAYRHVIDA